MKTKIIIFAYFASTITVKAQQVQTRSAIPFHKIETHGSVNVIYTNSDTINLRVSADSKEIANVETKFENSTLIINNRGKFTKPVFVYIKNNQLTDVQSTGSSSFKTTNSIKVNSIDLSVSGSAEILAKLQSSSVKVTQSGSASLKLIGTSTNFSASLSGASILKASDLNADKVVINTSGAATATVYANTKLNANATNASNITIKGKAKEISTDTSPGATITQFLD